MLVKSVGVGSIMEKEKKPLHKKWWFWLVVIIAIPATVGIIDGVNSSNSEQVETEEVTADEEEVIEEQIEEELSIIEYDERFLFADFTVENIQTEINDNELTLKFNWINQSELDKTPFTAVGYLDVTQGDEVLEYKSDNPQIHDRNAQGGVLPVTMKYDLASDEPIRLLFGATSEYDDTEEELIIEID